MADPQKPRKAQKVSQATIDSMKQMGMTKAIKQANSGTASAEFIEGAKRMYGNRINPTGTTASANRTPGDRSPLLKTPIAVSPTVTKTAARAPAAKKSTTTTGTTSAQKGQAIAKNTKQKYSK